MVFSISMRMGHMIMESAGAEDLSRRGHDDGERDVFSSILLIVLFGSRACECSDLKPSTITLLKTMKVYIVRIKFFCTELFLTYYYALHVKDLMIRLAAA